MTKECDNCKGDGLVGGGDQPHLKQGAVSTCKLCSGTGKVEEVQAPAPAEEVATPPADVAPATDEPKKNEVSADSSDSSQDVPADTQPPAGDAPQGNVDPVLDVPQS